MSYLPLHRPPPSRNVYPNQLVHSVCVVFDRQSDICVSLHVSRIPCHTDLNPGWNVYLTSWFILSVLFLTGGETSVVPTCVWDPRHMDLHPGGNVYLTSWFILSVLFLADGEMSVVPTCIRDSPSHGPPPW